MPQCMGLARNFWQHQVQRCSAWAGLVPWACSLLSSCAGRVPSRLYPETSQDTQHYAGQGISTARSRLPRWQLVLPRAG